MSNLGALIMLGLVEMTLAFHGISQAFRLIRAPWQSQTPHIIMSAESSTADDLFSHFPEVDTSPIEVVTLQCRALQEGNGQVYWRFLSPEEKRATGILRPSRRSYLTHPKYHELPLYAPFFKCRRFEIVGALPIGESKHQCRVRVWPAGGERECAGDWLPALPIVYIMHVALQPLVRPVCYEDDPLQQGISTGPPFSGCWLGGSVQRDDRWRGDDDDDDRTPAGPLGGDGSLRIRTAMPTSSRTLVSPSVARWAALVTS